MIHKEFIMASFADVKKKVALDRISSSDAAQAIVPLPSDGGKAAIRPMKVKERAQSYQSP